MARVGVDFPADTAGCDSATDEAENNDLEDIAVPERQNNFDDDSDPHIYPADGKCSNGHDASEVDAGDQDTECVDVADSYCSTAMADDFPADPDCSSADDNDEAFEQECSNGIDDDDDGTIDKTGVNP